MVVAGSSAGVHTASSAVVGQVEEGIWWVG